MLQLPKSVGEGRALAERRLAALEEMGPPFNDVRQYLDGNLYKVFLDSLSGAIDAYLDGGKGCMFSDWRYDSRAGLYIGFIQIIRRKKQEEALRRQADVSFWVRIAAQLSAQSPVALAEDAEAAKVLGCGASGAQLEWRSALRRLR